MKLNSMGEGKGGGSIIRISGQVCHPPNFLVSSEQNEMTGAALLAIYIVTDLLQICCLILNFPLQFISDTVDLQIYSQNLSVQCWMSNFLLQFYQSSVGSQIFFFSFISPVLEVKFSSPILSVQCWNSNFLLQFYQSNVGSPIFLLQFYQSSVGIPIFFSNVFSLVLEVQFFSPILSVQCWNSNSLLQFYQCSVGSPIFHINHACSWETMKESKRLPQTPGHF